MGLEEVKVGKKGSRLIFLSIGPVRRTPYSAYFFSRNSVFLLQQFSQNSIFQSVSAKFQQTEQGLVSDANSVDMHPLYLLVSTAQAAAVVKAVSTAQ